MPSRLHCLRATIGRQWPGRDDTHRAALRRHATTGKSGAYDCVMAPLGRILMPVQEQFSILLVDHDPTVVRVLNRILQEFAPIRFANSGREALKLASESVPDLVLLDVNMPEM